MPGSLGWMETWWGGVGDGKGREGKTGTTDETDQGRRGTGWGGGKTDRLGRGWMMGEGWKGWKGVR